MVKRNIWRQEKSNSKCDEDLITFLSSTLNIVMLVAAASPEQTANCTLDNFLMVVVHYAPQSAVLGAGMRNECCMFDRC
jgi:hypothetical protein